MRLFPLLLLLPALPALANDAEALLHSAGKRATSRWAAVQAKVPAVNDLILICADMSTKWPGMMSSACLGEKKEAESCGIRVHVANAGATGDVYRQIEELKLADKSLVNAPAIFNMHGTVVRPGKAIDDQPRDKPHQVLLKDQKVATRDFVRHIRGQLPTNPLFFNSCGSGLAVENDDDPAGNIAGMCQFNQVGRFGAVFSPDSKDTFFAPRTWPALKLVLCDRNEFLRFSGGKKHLNRVQMEKLFRHSPGGEYRNHATYDVLGKNEVDAKNRALELVLRAKENCPDADKALRSPDGTETKNFSFSERISPQPTTVFSCVNLRLLPGKTVRSPREETHVSSPEECQNILKAETGTVKTPDGEVAYCKKFDKQSYQVDCECQNYQGTKILLDVVCRTRSDVADILDSKSREDEFPAVSPKFQLTCDNCSAPD